ncbi:uncharacterized protein VNE69_09027 [Vairimorpha necatrix]|uniref:Uncharacterized protein n=1 Tax=Vairimorpha necatrix TaxID=6039 RepID=A0AAX4JF47_9MICR
MDVSKLISLIVFIQGSKDDCSIIFMSLQNKLKFGEFNKFYIGNRYLEVKLTYDKTTHELVSFISSHNSNDNKEEYLQYIKVKCVNKSIKDVVNEFEEALIHKFILLRLKDIVVIYDPSCWENNLTYKKIINELKKLNRIRKENKDCSKISYEFIIHKNTFLYEVFKMKNFSKNIQNEQDRDNQQPRIVSENGKKYLSFFIIVNSICYHFEINIQELRVYKLFNLYLPTKYHLDPRDNLICQLFNELYMFSYIEDIQTLDNDFMPNSVKNKIQSDDKKFEIEIENDKVKFLHKSKIFEYFKSNRNFGIEKCYDEIVEFAEKILKFKQDKESCKIVELFFRLINCDVGIENYTKILFRKSETASNIIFAHVLLYHEIIEVSELNTIIENVDINIDRRKELVRTLLDNLSDGVYPSSNYLIKFFLFNEAENYIKENDVKDSIFSRLMRIANLLKARETSFRFWHWITPMSCIPKETFNLATMINELLKCHYNEILSAGTEKMQDLNKAASCFTQKYNSLVFLIPSDESSDISYRKNASRGYYREGLYLSIKTLIKISENEALEVSRKSTTILKEEVKILEQNIQNGIIDKHYILQFTKSVKELLAKLIRIQNNDDLIRIMDNAAKKKSGNLLDIRKREKFEKKLKMDLEEVLKKIYKKSSELFVQVYSITMNINKEIINEYKKEEEEILSKKIRSITVKNAQLFNVVDLSNIVIPIVKKKYLRNKQLVMHYEKYRDSIIRFDDYRVLIEIYIRYGEEALLETLMKYQKNYFKYKIN